MKRSTKLLAFIIVVILGVSACSFATIAANAARAGSTVQQQLSTAVALPTTPAAQPPAANNVAPTPAVFTQSPGSTSESVAAMEGTLEQIYNQVNPSVVYIEVLQQASATGNSPFGNQGSQITQASGSGFVWDKQGDIVTNNHVVDGATQVNVTFSDGTIVPAKVVGTDVNSDLAVVKVNVSADLLRPITLTDSTQVKVGQLAIAIGNPYGLQGSMSVGIISGLSRTLDVAGNSQAQQQGQMTGTYSIPDIIQTDAAINPGNSGGVLLNDQGQVIGVTSAIASSVDANSGVGFVIPSVIVNRVVPSLIKTGRYNHPWLGISATTLTPELAQAMKLDANQHGVMVADITAGSPAANAGLQAGNQTVTISGSQVTIGGDVIVSINGQAVNRFEDLITYLERTTSPGDKVTLGILRNGKAMNVTVTLGTRPQS